MTKHSYHRANSLPHMALSAPRAAFCMHVETSSDSHGGMYSNGSDFCMEHHIQACTNDHKTVIRQQYTSVHNSFLRSHFRNTAKLRRIYLQQETTSAVSRASVHGFTRTTTKTLSTCIKSTAAMMLTKDRFGVNNPNMGWMAILI